MSVTDLPTWRAAPQAYANRALSLLHTCMHDVQGRVCGEDSNALQAKIPRTGQEASRVSPPAEADQQQQEDEVDFGVDPDIFGEWSDDDVQI